MQPKPTAETCGPLRPNWRVFMRELSGYVLLGAIMRVSAPTFDARQPDGVCRPQPAAPAPRRGPGAQPWDRRAPKPWRLPLRPISTVAWRARPRPLHPGAAAFRET